MNAPQLFFFKLQGSAYIGYNLLRQTQIPYLPNEQLGQLRDRRVRSIVRYAAETVPYYRDLFQRERLDPTDIRTAADLAALPLIEKQQLRERPEYFRSQSQRGQTGLPLKTSGSTGVPLTIYHDRYDFLSNAVAGQRQKAALREALGGQRHYSQVSIAFRGYMTDFVRGFISQNAFVPGPKQITTLSFLDPLEQVIDQINELQPDILDSYGSYLELLYAGAASLKKPLHKPRLVMYGSDMLSEKGRDLIKTSHGVPILSTYGTVETFNIGFSCLAETGVHINEDRMHVRVVNASGQNAKPGEVGEVILSNLSNRGTVLLNYRLGDLAALSPERCACGRTLPRLLQLEGRAEDIVRLPGGRYVHPRAIWRVLRPRNDIAQYQLIQLTPDSFELRLAMTDSSLFEQSAAEIVALLVKELGEPVTIQPVYVSALEPYGSQKRRPVVALPKPA